MTDELTKTFFDTFGIKLKSIFKGCKLGIDHYTSTCIQETCKGCKYEIREKEYPQITDRILLELICILAYNPTIILFEYMFSGIKEVELLKNSILLNCI